MLLKDIKRLHPHWPLKIRQTIPSDLLEVLEEYQEHHEEFVKSVEQFEIPKDAVPIEESLGEGFKFVGHELHKNFAFGSFSNAEVKDVGAVEFRYINKEESESEDESDLIPSKSQGKVKSNDPNQQNQMPKSAKDELKNVLPSEIADKATMVCIRFGPHMAIEESEPDRKLYLRYDDGFIDAESPMVEVFNGGAFVRYSPPTKKDGDPSQYYTVTVNSLTSSIKFIRPIGKKTIQIIDFSMVIDRKGSISAWEASAEQGEEALPLESPYFCSVYGVGNYFYLNRNDGTGVISDNERTYEGQINIENNLPHGFGKMKVKKVIGSSKRQIQKLKENLRQRKMQPESEMDFFAPPVSNKMLLEEDKPKSTQQSQQKAFEFNLVFEGEFSNGHFIKGKMESDDTIIEGEFDPVTGFQGKGKGRLLSNPGSTFNSRFQKVALGQPPREGEKYFDLLYEGEIVQGRMEGKGKATIAGVGSYEGGFMMNKFHGYGELTRPDGSVMKGKFENGNPSGKMSVVYKNGKIEYFNAEKQNDEAEDENSKKVRKFKILNPKKTRTHFRFLMKKAREFYRQKRFEKGDKQSLYTNPYIHKSNKNLPTQKESSSTTSTAQISNFTTNKASPTLFTSTMTQTISTSISLTPHRTPFHSNSFNPLPILHTAKMMSPFNFTILQPRTATSVIKLFKYFL
jgi:hypothetical protein